MKPSDFVKSTKVPFMDALKSSGNFGHKGRPGEVGGSGSGGASVDPSEHYGFQKGDSIDFRGDDGEWYPGTVLGYTNSDHFMVQDESGEKMEVYKTHVVHGHSLSSPTRTHSEDFTHDPKDLGWGNKPWGSLP